MKKLVLLWVLVLTTIVQLYAQNKQISGKVTSSDDGSGLPGVNVSIKGTSRGVTTDNAGNYRINVNDGATLVYSFVGYSSQSVSVGNRTVIDVVLSADNQQLNEVVVVGYGTVQKKDLTSSISTIKGAEIANLATPSFDRQLAGRASGVQVITPSGLLGQAPQIRIRGVASISGGNSPLIVIDGVPSFSGNAGAFTSANALADLNPSDIESFEVLKDGAATAIYGSRAAAGVILITTKRGKAGQVKFTYDSNFGQAKASNLFELLDANQFITIANERFTNAGQNPQAKPTVLDGREVNTNWLDAVFRTALQQNHTISATAGSDKTKYFVSLGYSDQNGIAVANSLKRYSLRTNLDQKVTKYIDFGLNLGLTAQENLGPLAGSNNLSGNTFAAMRMLPNVPVYSTADATGYNIDASDRRSLGRGGNSITISDGIPNIRFVLDNNIRKALTYRALGGAFLNFSLAPGLKFKTQFGIDASFVDDFLYQDPRHGDGFSANGILSQSYSPTVRWNFQNVLTYNKTFAQKHNLDFTAVQELQKTTGSFYNAQAQNISDIFFNRNIISNTFVTPLVSGSLSESSIVSYLARVNYNYKGKYYVGGSYRADALSRLPVDNRWGFFPGVSFAWRVSEEKFIKDAGGLTFISDFRIRGSYGQVGNTEIGGDFRYLGTYGAAGYGAQSGIAFNNTGNPSLKWESQTTYDLGFDLAMFNNRVNLNFAYYNKDTDGLVLSAPTPPSLGVPGNSILRNVGRIMNDGIEVSVDATVLNKGDFTWKANLNFTTQRNEVKALVDNQDITGEYNIIRVGESINSIFGFIYEGVNKANGNPLYRKADGTVIQGNIATSSYRGYDPANPAALGAATSLTASDRVILGTALPKWFGGFNNTFTYKNFDLNLFLRYSGGNVIMNRTRQDLLSQNFVNNGTEILGRWISADNPGDGMTPRQWSARGTFINLDNFASTRFVEKGDFLRVDNISLGYRLPNTITKKLGVDRLRIYGAVQNAYVFTSYTGLDPETNTNGAGVDFNGNPQQRTFVVGLNLGF